MIIRKRLDFPLPVLLLNACWIWGSAAYRGDFYLDGRESRLFPRSSQLYSSGHTLGGMHTNIIASPVFRQATNILAGLGPSGSRGEMVDLDSSSSLESKSGGSAKKAKSSLTPTFTTNNSYEVFPGHKPSPEDLNHVKTSKKTSEAANVIGKLTAATFGLPLTQRHNETLERKMKEEKEKFMKAQLFSKIASVRVNSIQDQSNEGTGPDSTGKSPSMKVFPNKAESPPNIPFDNFLPMPNLQPIPNSKMDQDHMSTTTEFTEFKGSINEKLEEDDSESAEQLNEATKRIITANELSGGPIHPTTPSPAPLPLPPPPPPPRFETTTEEYTPPPSTERERERVPPSGRSRGNSNEKYRRRRPINNQLLRPNSVDNSGVKEGSSSERSTAPANPPRPSGPSTTGRGRGNSRYRGAKTDLPFYKESGGVFENKSPPPPEFPREAGIKYAPKSSGKDVISLLGGGYNQDRGESENQGIQPEGPRDRPAIVYPTASPEDRGAPPPLAPPRYHPPRPPAPPPPIYPPPPPPVEEERYRPREREQIPPAYPPPRDSDYLPPPAPPHHYPPREENRPRYPTPPREDYRNQRPPPPRSQAPPPPLLSQPGPYYPSPPEEPYRPPYPPQERRPLPPPPPERRPAPPPRGRESYPPNLPRNNAYFAPPHPAFGRPQRDPFEDDFERGGRGHEQRPPDPFEEFNRPERPPPPRYNRNKPQPPREYYNETPKIAKEAGRPFVPDSFYGSPEAPSIANRRPGYESEIQEEPRPRPQPPRPQRLPPKVEEDEDYEREEAPPPPERRPSQPPRNDGYRAPFDDLLQHTYDFTRPGFDLGNVRSRPRERFRDLVQSPIIEENLEENFHPSGRDDGPVRGEREGDRHQERGREREPEYDQEEEVPDYEEDRGRPPPQRESDYDDRDRPPPRHQQQQPSREYGSPGLLLDPIYTRSLFDYDKQRQSRPPHPPLNSQTESYYPPPYNPQEQPPLRPANDYYNSLIDGQDRRTPPPRYQDDEEPEDDRREEQRPQERQQDAEEEEEEEDERAPPPRRRGRDDEETEEEEEESKPKSQKEKKPPPKKPTPDKSGNLDEDISAIDREFGYFVPEGGRDVNIYRPGAHQGGQGGQNPFASVNHQNNNPFRLGVSQNNNPSRGGFDDGEGGGQSNNPFSSGDRGGGGREGRTRPYGGDNVPPGFGDPPEGFGDIPPEPNYNSPPAPQRGPRPYNPSPFATGPSGPASNGPTGSSSGPGIGAPGPFPPILGKRRRKR